MSYLLVTPAKNEEKYIRLTLDSVIKQTILPHAWVVVSDGSTDTTDDIIKEYSKKYPFIKYLRVGEEVKRNFKSKAFAFNKGYSIIADIDHDFIGNLDADVSFDERYFEKLLSRMNIDPTLGIGGGIIKELINGKYFSQGISNNSVAGAVQLFRKKCFTDIGGYFPLPGGGIDAVAEITARSKGWKVQTFKNLDVLHHRRVTTGNKNIYSNCFKIGTNFYSLGYHPLFFCVGRMSKIFANPFLLGSFLSILGYFWAMIKRNKQVLPKEVCLFLRKEQKNRLVSFFRFKSIKINR